MSNVCQFITVKELPALGYLYNNVCNDVTCAGMPVVLGYKKTLKTFQVFTCRRKFHTGYVFSRIVTQNFKRKTQQINRKYIIPLLCSQEKYFSTPGNR